MDWGSGFLAFPRALNKMQLEWLDPDELVRALLAVHAVGIASEQYERAASFAEEDPLVARVWYKDALESFAKKKVIDARAMQKILDALPVARTIAEDHKLRGRAYENAFTMVREAKRNIAKAVDEKIKIAIREGQTAADFMQNMNRVYDKVGLRQQDPWYTKLVYENATNRAFQEGIDAVAFEMEKDGILWGYRWEHTDSKEPRVAHKALDGFASSKDDPRWKQIGNPPIGHGCKCQRIAVTKAEAKRKKFDYSPPTPKIKEGDFKGKSALEGLDIIPGERFEKSQYNIETRSLLNPSWGVRL